MLKVPYFEEETTISCKIVCNFHMLSLIGCLLIFFNVASTEGRTLQQYKHVLGKSVIEQNSKLIYNYHSFVC